MATPIVTIVDPNTKKEVSKPFDCIRLDIIKEVNRIPSAEIVLREAGNKDEYFPKSKEGNFKPGKYLEIQLAYAGNPGRKETVFKGIVIRHRIKGSDQGTRLIVELKDSAYKLTTVRRSTVYYADAKTPVSDTDIIRQIIDEAKKKEAVTNPPFPIQGPAIDSAIRLYQHKESQSRYYCTDWDFILSRTDINGLLVIVSDGYIGIKPMPDLSRAGAASTPSHVFSIGIPPVVLDFEMEIDMRCQYNKIESYCWDIDEQHLMRKSQAKDFSIKQAKDVNVKEVNKSLGRDICKLLQPGVSEKDELVNWANAKMAKTQMAMVRGRITIKGDAKYKVSDLIKITKVSEMFNEITMITGVRHVVNAESGWRTYIQFGLSPQWFSENEDIAGILASGMLPPVNGLQIGVVDKYEEKKFGGDPRVRVKIEAMSLETDKKVKPVWARLSSADAGDKRGTFFRPEPGDEVILGFFNNDPRQPVILGSMYGTKKKNPPPFTPTDKNDIKGLVTKNGVKLQIDETKDACTITVEIPGAGKELNRIVLKQKEGITLSDQNKNTITMNDQGISLGDQHKNKITMSSAGIHLETNKNFTVKANNMKVE
ncbi:MAG: type VI secretion system tip protein VgrG [Flavobacteriaceae bacterium]|nr:MAG: type VI secretion system tip protein VgrG [Flavobacteriaceae bacterium]